MIIIIYQSTMLKSTPAQIRAAKNYYAKNNEEIKKKAKKYYTLNCEELKAKRRERYRAKKNLD
jgi:predicted Ser/Thr protein kinase